MSESIELVIEDMSSRLSPVIKNRIIEQKLDLKKERAEHDMNDTWGCCSGSKIDKRATVYFTQISIIVLTLAFCIYQLINLDSCEAQTTYIALLTLLIGLVFPSPVIKQ